MSFRRTVGLSLLFFSLYHPAAFAQGDPLMSSIDQGGPEPTDLPPLPEPAPIAAPAPAVQAPLPDAANTPPAADAPAMFTNDLPQLPPLDDQPPVPPAAPAADAGGVIDQFFSDTKIIPNQPKPAEPKKAEETPQDSFVPLGSEKEKPKKKIKVVAAKPAYNFKSQILPTNIYKKTYSTENRHLPKAISKEDLQERFAGVISRGDLSDTKALAAYGVSIDSFLPSGDTPLILATRYHRPQVMQWLLSQGARVNDTDTSGFSALHYAAYSGTTEMVDMLLSYGANPNITDTRGYTPLVYADIRQAEGVKSVIRAFGGIM